MPDLNIGDLISQSMGGLGGSSTANSGPLGGVDPETIKSIIDNMHTSVTGAMNAITGAQDAQMDISNQQQKLLNTAADTQSNAGAAAGRLASQQVTASQGVHELNTQAMQQFGVSTTDPSDALNSALNDSTSAYNNAKQALDSQKDAESATFLGALTGKNTFGQFLDANIWHTPEYYGNIAKTSITEAQLANSRIADLQGEYTGQTAINKSAVSQYTDASSADAATVAAAQYSAAATSLQNQALATGSTFFQNVVNSRLSMMSNAVGMAHSTAMVESLALRAQKGSDADVTSYLQLVQQGARAAGNPAAETMDKTWLAMNMKTPQGKLMIMKLANMGGAQIANASAGNLAPIAGLIGSTPGDSAYAIKMLPGSNPTPGTEPFWQLNRAQDAATPTTMNGKEATAADRAAAIDQLAQQYMNLHQKDLDATPTYGQVPAAAMVKRMSADPTVAPDALKVITTLAASTPTFPAAMLYDALDKVTSLSLNQKVAAMVSYGKNAPIIVNALRQPTKLGYADPTTVNYTAMMPTGNEIFGTKRSVNLGDVKDVTDFAFARQQALKAKQMQDILAAHGAQGL